MDVSDILASHAAKHQAVTVEKETPIIVDAGFLTVTDPNPIEEETYNSNLEEHLQSLARDGVQTLLAKLFSLPTTSSPDGPLAQLPPPTTQLPRAKPLPKPKPLTKWEQFAKAKGIQKTKREKKVWDEERQEWVNRWGKDGKNKQLEEQWATEVKLNADADHDPRKAARDARKARVAKNEKQRLGNVARAEQAAEARGARKNEIDRNLAQSRISTASMGKFDKKLEGEKKLRGIKRKFEPNEKSVKDEAKASLALLSRMDSDAKKMRKNPTSEESVLNVRKAVRFASKGEGGVALGRKSTGKPGKTGKRK
ncbi:Rhodanese-related sulfurtransferase [Marasmius tenuissimus]|uniref:Ribosome biogenesis regulatory protein n=1 Tax=Marasmius tenuissimus TaxID=585030 RepID=A0ABR2ZF28_9AGAR|nr:Rhodanese- sulfurtransferase [Marasmius tenuissimus]